MIRLILNANGKSVYDIKVTDMIKPELGEIISTGIYGENVQNFKVTFIQHCFNDDQEYMGILVTGILI